MTDDKMQLQLRLHDLIDSLRDKARVHHACAEQFEQQANDAETKLRQWLGYNMKSVRVVAPATPIELSQPLSAIVPASSRAYGVFQITDVYRLLDTYKRPVTIDEIKRAHGPYVARALAWWINKGKLYADTNADGVAIYDRHPFVAAVAGV